MEVYILEFAFFDQSEWKEVHYEITAISFEQLKEKFFDIVNNTGFKGFEGRPVCRLGIWTKYNSNGEKAWELDFKDGKLK